VTRGWVNKRKRHTSRILEKRNAGGFLKTSYHPSGLSARVQNGGKNLELQFRGGGDLLLEHSLDDGSNLPGCVKGKGKLVNNKRGPSLHPVPPLEELAPSAGTKLLLGREER